MVLTSEIEPLLVAESAILIDGAKAINSSPAHIALVTDASGRLVGTLTDGDLRRALLRGCSMDSSVVDAMRRQFITGKQGINLHELEMLREESGILQLPVLDARGRPVALLWRHPIEEAPGSDQGLPNVAVIMAGGLGTRLGSLTRHCPKPMLPIGDKPMLEIIIDQLRAAGLRRFFISVNYLKEVIQNYFGDGSALGVQIDYLIEDEPLGTAGSLSLLEAKTESPVVVINGDVLTRIDIRHFLSFHADSKAVLTMAVRKHSVPIPFGVINSDEGRIQSITEKPSFAFDVNAGIYVLEPAVIAALERGKHLDMTGLVQRLLDTGEHVAACPVHEYWIDIGRPEALDEALLSWCES